MIQSDKRPVQSNFANITDYSLKCPDGLKTFYAYITFTDLSTCLWSNIFTFDRRCAHLLVLEKFIDSLDYVHSISVHERD